MEGITHAFILKVFFGFFAIINPIAIAPVYIGLVKDFDEREQKTIAFKAVFFTFIIVAAFAVGGTFIFEVFGLTLPAFRITGGILIFHIGVELLQGKMSTVHSPSSTSKIDAAASGTRIAISPLAIPILAGPGTISTAMNFVADGNIMVTIVTISILALMCTITYLLFVFGEKLISFLGEEVVNVISRLMGLILAVIGTDMIITGIKGAFNLAQ